MEAYGVIVKDFYGVVDAGPASQESNDLEKPLDV